MHAAERMQPGKSKHARVLQVALRPAPVASRIVDDVRGDFLPAAAELGELANLVASTAHKGGFDEIVAENVATERRPSTQARQPAVSRKRLQPDDGVVTPVVALAELPERQPAGEHRALQPRAELDEAREQALAPDRHRQ